jgi:ATP-dependent DNA helicase DinG
MGYGRRLLAALPPMRKLDTRTEWLEMLDVLANPEGLTRTSTTAPGWT